MRLMIIFLEFARQAFAKSKLPGKFLGIDAEGDMKNCKVFFVHGFSAPYIVQKTLWPDASDYWQSSFSELERRTGQRKG
jgi:hypothetical protein